MNPPSYFLVGSQYSYPGSTSSTVAITSNRVSYAFVNTPIPMGRIDYVTILPHFSSDQTIRINDLRIIVCVIDQFSTYTGGSNNVQSTLPNQLLTVESVHHIHSVHNATQGQKLPSSTQKPLRVRVDPPIYILSSVEYPRYLGVHSPSHSINLNVNNVVNNVQSVWYQNSTYAPETNLAGGDILNHAGGLNYR